MKSIQFGILVSNEMEYSCGIDRLHTGGMGAAVIVVVISMLSCP